MTALQKAFFHREDAKDTKILKNEVQDWKSFSNRFYFSSRSLRLCGKKLVFSVDSSVKSVTFVSQRVFKKRLLDVFWKQNVSRGKSYTVRKFVTKFVLFRPAFDRRQARLIIIEAAKMNRQHVRDAKTRRRNLVAKPILGVVSGEQ